MKLVTLVLVLLCVIAVVAFGSAGFVVGYRTSSHGYSGYAPVLRTWFALDRYQVAAVDHLHGPFYAVKYQSRQDPDKQYCVMVDVSTRYRGAADNTDRFWVSAGVFTNAERLVCDF